MEENLARTARIRSAQLTLNDIFFADVVDKPWLVIVGEPGANFVG